MQASPTFLCPTPSRNVTYILRGNAAAQHSSQVSLETNTLRLINYPFQRMNRLYTSESDVYKRQILTSKDGPRTENIYNGRRPLTYEAERAN